MEAAHENSTADVVAALWEDLKVNHVTNDAL